MAIPVLSVVVAVLCVAVVVQAAYVSRLQRELAQVRRDVERIEEKPVAARSEAKRLDERLTDLEARTDFGIPVPQTGVESGSTAPPPQMAALPPEAQQYIEKLARRVENVEKQIREGKAGGEKKPPLAEVAGDLKVDSMTQARMAEVLDAGKVEAFDLLKTPRQDGGSFVDDFVAAIRSGNAEQEGGKIWIRLFSEKVPGTNDTYVARIMTIQQSVNDGIRNLLTPEQYQDYEHMALDPLQIKTGYDPWAEYFRQKGLELPDD